MAEVTPRTAEEREDRVRIALGIGTALMLVLALGCCCTGSLLVNATDDGSQTRHHAPRRH